MALIVVVLLVAGFVVACKIAARKIRGKITMWNDRAEQRGCELSLFHRATPDLEFDMFTSVSDKKITTTLTRTGSNDSAFLYKFDVRTGDVEHRHRRTCALVELPFRAPKTTLRPWELQTTPSKPTDAPDAELGIADFDAAYRLQTDDEEFARRWLDTDFAAWLMTPAGRMGEIEFELRDGWMLCSGPDVDDVDPMVDFFEWVQEIRDRTAASFSPTASS